VKALPPNNDGQIKKLLGTLLAKYDK
jgi:hypothetical protein